MTDIKVVKIKDVTIIKGFCVILGHYLLMVYIIHYYKDTFMVNMRRFFINETIRFEKKNT